MEANEQFLDEESSDASLLGDGNEGGLNDGLPSPGDVRRKCTDLGALVVFLIFVGAIHAWLWASTSRNVDINSLVAFRDGYGELCDKEITNSSTDQFLYFCMLPSGSLNTSFPLCVSICPSVNGTADERCGGGLAGYSTYVFRGQLCRPLYNADLGAQVREQIDTARARWVFRMLLTYRDEYISCAAMAIVLSYGWFYFLYLNAGCLINFGIFMAASVPISMGLFLAGFTNYIPLVKDCFPVAPPKAEAQFEAACLFIVGIAFGGILSAMRHAINRAVDCLEMSFICICQTRMIMHPLVVAVLYAVCTYNVFYGIVLWKAANPDMSYDSLSLDGAGIFWMMVFCWFWISQSIFTFSEMALVFITTTWCNKGGIISGEASLTGRDLCRAYWITLRYHLGTCVLGALLVGLFRPIHLTVGGMIRFSRMKNNPLGILLDLCCEDCLAFWDTSAALLNKSTYIDVVLSGRPFCAAAREVKQVMDKQVDAIKILNGATRILQTIALTFNAGLAGHWVAFSVGHMHWSNGREFGFVVLMGAFVAFVVSLPFVLLFDTVADTILYCVELREQHAQLLKAKSVKYQHSPCLPCLNRGLWTSPLDVVSNGFSMT
mmetsp:Transcript_162667/g.521559  ORF Transcript_162667/g.521559 Transcript_162667/m.521559 type:complete len:605 (+) Transcript_162667:48-1862(+)